MIRQLPLYNNDQVNRLSQTSFVIWTFLLEDIFNDISGSMWATQILKTVLKLYGSLLSNEVCTKAACGIVTE